MEEESRYGGKKGAFISPEEKKPGPGPLKTRKGGKKKTAFRIWTPESTRRKRGGSPRRGGDEGPGECRRRIGDFLGGGGLNIFVSGPKCPPSKGRDYSVRQERKAMCFLTGDKLTMKKWWIFGADFFTVYAELFTVYKGRKR